ncbi:MAG: hypothetical protein ABIX28_20340 [Vicinamibacterales bacterium]
MARPILCEQSTTEYFRELVGEAMSARQMRATDLTEYYLVNLLCQYVRPEARSDHQDAAQPLAFRLGRALETGGFEQRARLRSLGDFSLFMSGFFPDSFRRRVIDVDYYKSMGEYAYGSLGQSDHDTFADVFRELAVKFVGFMDVLALVSERTQTAAPAGGGDTLRLYEKWLRTGSVRDGQRLVERGVVPNHSIGSRFVQ